MCVGVSVHVLGAVCMHQEQAVASAQGPVAAACALRAALTCSGSEIPAHPAPGGLSGSPRTPSTTPWMDPWRRTSS